MNATANLRVVFVFLFVFSALANQSRAETPGCVVAESAKRQIALSNYVIESGRPFSLVLYSSGLTSQDVVKFEDGTRIEASDLRPTSVVIAGLSESKAGQSIRVMLERDGCSQVKPVTVQIIEPVGDVPLQTATNSRMETIASRSANSEFLETPRLSNETVTASGAAMPSSTAEAVAPTAISHATTSTAPTVVTPTITSITPSVPGNAVASITITGTGYSSTTEVLLAGSPLTVTSATATKLTATGFVALTPGNVWAVQVFNPTGSKYSNIVGLQVANTSPTPTTLSDAAARRFLRQATWGPTPMSIRHLEDVGIDTWINEQFDPERTPVSQYQPPTDTTTGVTGLQEQFFKMAVAGPDQLRQRVAFALGQIAVVSDNKLSTYESMMGYEQMLLNDAFGTYSDFLKDVTLSPSMGVYLDMVNNDLPSATNSPDENYAREVMQLMSIGLVQLNPDGTIATGATATYGQSDVEGLARVFTGWTYPSCGAPPAWTDPKCFNGPMIAFEQHHDQTAKTVLGTVIQTGSAEGDLNAALQTILSVPSSDPTVPNVAPFVAYRLIQHLVTSNPSPDYVERVARVFAATQGDLKEVIRSILEDSAAGYGNGGVNLASGDGHLAEPVLYAVELLRALNANVVYDPPLQTWTLNMGQDLFNPPSVFNYYPPNYNLPGTTTPAPEFDLFTQVTALQHIQYAYNAVRNGIASNIYVNLSNLAELASDNNTSTRAASITVMLNGLGEALLGQPLSSDMVNAIMPAMLATTNATQRVQNALILVASLGQFQVQR